MAFNTIPELLEDIRAGRMVVILDDEDRENEGDLIMAASMVRPEDINFMVREARGLVCLALTEQRCRQLGLKPMVSDNTSPYHTNFTVSIEAAEGVTTGISAYDRARTVQAAVKADARPADLTQPGHIFPLTAQPGGVLRRAGHTEAAADLAGLAGLEPAGVLVEVLHEDGSMARRPELEAFAAKHGLKIGTIADLISYRMETEKTVERVHESEVDTEAGTFRLVAYRDLLDHGLHFALVRGTVDDDAPVLTRVHMRNTLSDVLHLKRDDLGLTVTAALRRIAEEQRGVLLVLSGADTADALMARLEGRAPQREDEDAQQQEWRQLGLGAQILADLGVHRLRVLGTPRKLVGLGGFGLEVVEHV
ncbi:bifunctional 3,4-dihydroxy-2-butanone-4-phosphate synthase/GTP cyclohydrolase II [Oleiagrimonas soli]|uniref:3,4-dihydroxy-2-butanone 4-phosphate synthase n=1 Tax=Oleiagrimonas soli TaxID=1543381 RepID=A0A099CXW0_9GAMM|nr:bifunctional 3,4-dihydroxy-2-butanone-4-phosphate synthase/GTP cyclohydrolase II [Oleiagrimonas soli]KGI78574.1 3,4-dihydroxy-2-butanone 4-phosphate synthase [Oleiagrimonas soli]MBB6184139.1 3,4-dihydroxy 2-butanone 4-phosphate synthase/GTP cyclohydrolase II [Oleiagrimonas soli]